MGASGHACRGQAFAVAFNNRLNNVDQFTNAAAVVNAPTDQSADVAVGTTVPTGANIAVAQGRASLTDDIYSTTGSLASGNGEILVDVVGSPAGGELTGQQVNFLCARRRNTANYIRNMRLQMGTGSNNTLATSSGGQEYDIWQFDSGDRVLVRNRSVVVHRAASTATRELQVLFNYTQSQGDNFTAYGSDHADRLNAQNIGAMSDSSTAANASPEVRGSVPLAVSTGSIVNDIVNSTEFQALALEATLNTTTTNLTNNLNARSTQISMVQSTLNNQDSTATTRDTAIRTGLRGAFDSLTDGTIYQSGTTNFPED